MIHLLQRCDRRYLMMLALVVVLALAGLAVVAGPAGAYSSYKHDGATTCGSCHPGGDTNVVPTDANCTACHTGGFVARSTSQARTCWSCHDPGESMSVVQTGAGCAAGCHSATPHLGSNLQACTLCHGVTQSATDPGTSAHHDNTTVYSAPTCSDCHASPHAAYVVGAACATCHVGVEPTHPAAAAMPAPTLAFTATPAVVTYGASSVLGGSLKNGATPLVGKTITLQARPAGSAAFADVTTAVTAADGTFAFAAVSPTVMTTYRAVAPGAMVTATTVRPSLKTLDLQVAPLLTLSLSKTSIKLGAKVTAKGAITPLRPAATVKVVIQKKGTTWKTVKTVNRALDASGAAYTYTYKPLKKGTYRVQASVAATADLAAFKTALKTFKVK